MMKDIDVKNFQAKLNEDFPDNPFTEEEAKVALRNLGEFFWLLYQINERERIIPLDELAGEVPHDRPHNP